MFLLWLRTVATELVAIHTIKLGYR